MILHVACLPFPSRQGTQAAIAAMLRASAATGQPTHLLSYAHGAYELDAGYEIHRIPDFPKVRSLRSGPSWGKIALDVRCIAETRKLANRLRPRAIIAHHVEAALAALAANVGPVYYVAHTCLSRELAIYFPRLPAQPVGQLGGAVERFICARVAGVGAIAPSLVTLIGGDATYLPVPWHARERTPARREARAALGLPVDAPIGLYAGNLDRYQGWEHLIEATAYLRRTHPKAELLIATESGTAPALREAQKWGVAGSVSFRRLDGERARALAHAASDIAWVPRRTEGGLPIKMLDAFGRKIPVIATERATAGLPVQRACEIVANDDACALAAAAVRLIESRRTADTLCEAGALYLTARHSESAYAEAMKAMLGATNLARLQATPPVPHPPTEPALRAR